MVCCNALHRCKFCTSAFFIYLYYYYSRFPASHTLICSKNFPQSFYFSFAYIQSTGKTEAFISSFGNNNSYLVWSPQEYSARISHLILKMIDPTRKILVLPSFYSSRNLTSEQWQPQIAQPAGSHVPNRREDLNPRSLAGLVIILFQLLRSETEWNSWGQTGILNGL